MFFFDRRNVCVHAACRKPLNETIARETYSGVAQALILRMSYDFVRLSQYSNEFYFAFAGFIVVVILYIFRLHF